MEWEIPITPRRFRSPQLQGTRVCKCGVVLCASFPSEDLPKSSVSTPFHHLVAVYPHMKTHALESQLNTILSDAQRPQKLVLPFYKSQYLLIDNYFPFKRDSSLAAQTMHSNEQSFVVGFTGTTSRLCHAYDEEDEGLDAMITSQNPGDELWNRVVKGMKSVRTILFIEYDWM